MYKSVNKNICRVRFKYSVYFWILLFINMLPTRAAQDLLLNTSSNFNTSMHFKNIFDYNTSLVIQKQIHDERLLVNQSKTMINTLDNRHNGNRDLNSQLSLNNNDSNIMIANTNDIFNANKIDAIFEQNNENSLNMISEFVNPIVNSDNYELDNEIFSLPVIPEYINGDDESNATEIFNHMLNTTNVFEDIIWQTVKPQNEDLTSDFKILRNKSSIKQSSANTSLIKDEKINLKTVIKTNNLSNSIHNISQTSSDKSDITSISDNQLYETLFSVSVNNCSDNVCNSSYKIISHTISNDFVDLDIDSDVPFCSYLSAADCNCTNGPIISCRNESLDNDDHKCIDANKTCKLKKKKQDSYIIGWYGCRDNGNNNLEKCMSYLINDNENDTNTLLIIIMSLVLPIICVTLFIYIYYIWYVKNNNCSVFKKILPSNSREHFDITPNDGNAVINMEFQSHVDSKSKPIQITYFEQYYRSARADSNLKFEEEFSDLRNICGQKKLAKISQLSINRPKNRFVNILPYDHSMVTLKLKNDEIGSDYINANFIPGINSEREYIACQGPLNSTINDFFRMIIEHNVKVIVMLTQCVEKGRQKCEKYWPNYEEVKEDRESNIPELIIEDIRVELHKQTMFKDFVTRELKVIHDNTWHFVTQYHFTQWPDFGCPQDSSSLINLIKEMRQHLETLTINNNFEQNSPILVHCSAGVGRSGTFIAIDRIWQNLSKNGLYSNQNIDIFGTVYEMREFRSNMVQTEDQYIYIYDCVKYLIGIIESKKQLKNHSNDATITVSEESIDNSVDESL